MADETQNKSLFVELRSLARAIVELVRAVRPAVSNDARGEEAPLPLMLPPPEKNFEGAQLLTQNTPGWHVPRPASLAAPTYAPAMTAFAIVFIALGAVTKWPLSVIGALIFVGAIAKWIGELLHD